MKICTKCKVSKPESEFALVKGKLFSQCRVCKNKANKDWYEKNKATRIKQVQVRKKDQIIKAYNWKWKYLLNKGCEWDDCDINDPRMLELDHLDRKTKVKSVSEMIREGYTLDTIKAEAEKCRVLCANHHRLWTSEQMGWWMFTHNIYVKHENGFCAVAGWPEPIVTTES